MNVWNFTGNLGQEAEQRFTQDGTSIVSFSVAVRSGFGEREATTWARCAMFGKRGESVLPYLIRGQQVAVSGEVTLRDWTDKEGMKRSSLEVRVNDLTLVGRRDETQQSQPRQQQAPQRQPAQNQHAQASGGGMAALDDDTIPF